MLTKVIMTGFVNNTKHNAIFETKSSPEDIFSNSSINELFKRQTGAYCSDVKFELSFEIKTSFGTAGFKTNDIDMAIIRSKELLEQTPDEIFVTMLEHLPQPEILHEQAVELYMQGDHKKAEEICKIIAVVAELTGFTEVSGIDIKKFAKMGFEIVKNEALKKGGNK
jgi:hypothetical protein